MGREKLKKANEIMAKMVILQELASDLQSANFISFFVHDRSADKRVAVLWNDGDFVRNTADGRQLLIGTDAIDLFNIVMGEVMAKLEDKLKALEDDFDKL